MLSTKVIETSLDNIKLAYLDKNDTYFEVEKFADLDDIDEKDKLKMIFEIFQCSFDILIESLKEDLKDIWERLDGLED